jgi:hypothetical protein
MNILDVLSYLKYEICQFYIIYVSDFCESTVNFKPLHLKEL